MSTTSSKKTIKVDTCRTLINQQLASSTDSPDYRLGLMHILENMLHLTGNYNGFRYLDQREVPDNHLPGIRWTKDVLGNVDPSFHDTDNTRVFYY